jgi:hypothetical protein
LEDNSESIPPPTILSTEHDLLWTERHQHHALNAHGMSNADWASCIRTQRSFTVGGPVAKVPFFQMVQTSLLSVLIYSARCEYDILKVLFLKNDQNLSVECVKHRNVPR